MASANPNLVSQSVVTGLLAILQEELELIYCKIDFNLKYRELILEKVRMLTQFQDPQRKPEAAPIVALPSVIISMDPIMADGAPLLPAIELNTT